MTDDEGNGAMFVDLTGVGRLWVRRHGEGLLAMSLEQGDAMIESMPVLVDLAAFLVDLQLTHQDCKRALDDFGNQGFDMPDTGDAP